MKDEAEKKMKDEAEKKMKDMKDKAEKKMKDEAANRDGILSKNRTAKNSAPPQNNSFGVKILIGALITSVIFTIAGFVVYSSSNHCVVCNTTLTTTPNMTNFPNLTIEHPRIPNFENEVTRFIFVFLF